MIQPEHGDTGEHETASGGQHNHRLAQPAEKQPPDEDAAGEDQSKHGKSGARAACAESACQQLVREIARARKLPAHMIEPHAEDGINGQPGGRKTQDPRRRQDTIQYLRSVVRTVAAADRPAALLPRGITVSRNPMAKMATLTK